ncbi:hypothetical protein JNW91_28995 [Micromonospora sp. STR1_7]|uniref:Uncharacterized protein n=1 Tax=Micromonospora parastrephiae TaxID=2806101 RepID=A0ABS1Y1S4_9ACTN|nr:hypothetical protein [Micromonospora parastrephiae]MBM0235461.1 hypothetical protein [Micromonospora parastrephiae]
MAARGKKLSDAYLELRADDSKLSGDVKVKATKAAKGFASQLNNALKVLDIDPIDVKADPKSALASIEAARTRLRAMSREADSVEMRVRTERALSQLARFEKQLGQVDDVPVEPKVEASPAQRVVDQLQRRLAALGVDPPVTIDADPKTALASIGRVDEQLEKLTKDAGNVRLRLDATAARTDLARLRDQIGDVGDDAAEGFSTRFVGRLGPLIASMPLSPPMLAAVGIAAAVAAPTLAGALAAAVVGGAGAGGIVGGAILASRDERVKAAGSDLGEFILGDLESRAGVFVGPMLANIGRIRRAWIELGPDLDRIFASSRFVDPLVAGAVSGARKLIGGVADAVDEAEPVIAEFGAGLDRIGEATGDAFSLLAHDADEAASAVEDVTILMAELIRVQAGLVHGLAAAKGWTDQLDIWDKKLQFMIEDQANLNKIMGVFGYRLDITADGFAAGTKEAEAFRKAQIGEATAADFATLKLAGKTDAQIAAADASGTYRQRIDEVNAAMGRSADATVATEESVSALQLELDGATARYRALGEIGAEALNGLLVSSGAVSGAMVQQKSIADALRQAHEGMFGAVIQQTEANEAYQTSWDNLSASVKENAGQIGKNKNNLDLHTQAGRSNRDALQELLVKSGEMYYADIEAGVAVDEARKKHEKRTAAIRTEAGQLKLNKSETDKLIGTYGNIPPKKTTQLLVEGIERVGQTLTDLYIFQRSLATGRTLAQVRSDVFGGYAGNPRAFKREGGSIDGHGIKGVDSVPIVAAPGEFMQPVPAVDYYGVAAMQAIRHRQIPKEALQGYATGGLIDRLRGRDWGARMPYETDVSRSRVPSREEVASKVTPALGSWPSSPGAQRGDSGVWRSIMAMVKASGIPYSFGNAYRPGDPLWHGSGRAVDFMGYNQDRLAQFFMARQGQLLELIHRTGTRDYAVTRGRKTTMPTQLPLHRNHLHVAMDNGGYLMPGWNPPIYNGTGRPEPVTPAPIMDTVIERLEQILDEMRHMGPAFAEALTGGVQSARQSGRARGAVLAR